MNTISGTGRDVSTSVWDQVHLCMYTTVQKILFEEINALFNNNFCVHYHRLGAHGRFVPRAVGGVQREARTQTLEPDVWIREVQRHGHGTRRRIQLDHHGL